MVSFLFAAVGNHKNAFSLLVFLLIASICYKMISVFLGGNSERLSLSPLAYVDAFALGGLVAITPSVCKSARFGLTVCAVGLVGIIGLLLLITSLHNCSFIQVYKLCHSYEVYFGNCVTAALPSFFSILWSGVIIILQSVPSFGGKWCSWLGGLSYCLYLIHFPISGFVRSCFPYSNKTLLYYLVMLLMLFAMIAIAFAYLHIKHFIQCRVIK